MSELFIIGVEPGCGLDDRKQGALRRCGSVFGPERLLDLAQPLGLSCFGITPLADALNEIERRLVQENVAVLSGGDPLFFGIGKTLIERFGRERVIVLPAVSSMQLAFARLKEPWDDAIFISVHGRDRDDLPALVLRHPKLCILTGGKNSPSIVAGRLLESGAADISAHVLENLGLPEERITSGSLDAISKGAFGELSLLVLLRPDVPVTMPGPVFGLTEEEIRHSRGLITKDEIRAAALHALRLPEIGVLWDIGAGSGSVSVEAARLTEDLRVFAIEKDSDHLQNIRANATVFSPNRLMSPSWLTIVSGEAPAACENLPAPDRVFIGGSGGQMAGIIDLVARRLKPDGRVVVTAVTEKTRKIVPLLLQDRGFTVTASTIVVTRSQWTGGHEETRTLNPITVITGVK